MIVVMLFWISALFSTNTEGAPRGSYRGRSSYSSRAAAAARAQRAQMISNLQKQVASAREVLKNLESQAVMTQAQLSSSSTKLEGIQQDIEDIRKDAVQAAKSLREIESEITLAQSSGSEFGKASAAVDDAKKAVHQAIHEVLKLPLENDQHSDDPVRDHLQKVSELQRAALNADARYKNADVVLRAAIRNLSQARTRMFQANKDWAASHQDLIDANQKKHEEEKSRRQTGTAVTGKKHELQNMASVAANARSVIAMGEYQLRQMGASTGSNQNSPKSNGPAPKKKN